MMAVVDMIWLTSARRAAYSFSDSAARLDAPKLYFQKPNCARAFSMHHQGPFSRLYATVSISNSPQGAHRCAKIMQARRQQRWCCSSQTSLSSLSHAIVTRANPPVAKPRALQGQRTFLYHAKYMLTLPVGVFALLFAVSSALSPPPFLDPHSETARYSANVRSLCTISLGSGESYDPIIRNFRYLLSLSAVVTLNACNRRMPTVSSGLTRAYTLNHFSHASEHF